MRSWQLLALVFAILASRPGASWLLAVAAICMVLLDAWLPAFIRRHPEPDADL